MISAGWTVCITRESQPGRSSGTQETHQPPYFLILIQRLRKFYNEPLMTVVLTWSANTLTETLSMFYNTKFFYLEKLLKMVYLKNATNEMI